MTNKHSMSDSDLNDLYQSRKRRFKSPGAIKRKIMSHQQPFPTQKWIQRFAGFTIATGVLVMFGLINLQQFSSDDIPTPVEYQPTAIHTLAAQPTSPRESINSRYAEHYQKYLSQQALIAQHHSRPARLSIQDGVWQLETCDEELLSISEDLVAALRDIGQVDNAIKTGDPVEVLFARTGIILGIRATDQQNMCT